MHKPRPISISAMKGITPLIIWLVFILYSSGITPLRKKIATANGGVMKDICRLIHIIIANQSSWKPSCAAIGVTSGTMINRIPNQPMKKPRMNTRNMTIVNTPHLPPGNAISKSDITSCPPRAMKTPVKHLAPIATSAIIPVTLAVARVTCFKIGKVRPLRAIASPVAQKAPTAAASVGAAIPKKILPSTAPIRTMTGITEVKSRRIFSFNLILICSLGEGARLGLR